MYAFHKLKFKLADRRIEKRIQKKWWFIPIGTEVSIEHERVKFASNDIINIKETYMKHKALEALKCNGIINAIIKLDILTVILKMSDTLLCRATNV